MNCNGDQVPETDYSELALPHVDRHGILVTNQDDVTATAELELDDNDGVNKLEDIRIDQSIDWFGNTILHHAFAHDKDDIDLFHIDNILSAYPESAYITNQFGRLPLHYAVDRLRFSHTGIEKLIRHNPDGVVSTDNEGMTPYDLVVKWKHTISLRKLLLENTDKSFLTPQQIKEWRRIRFGCLLGGLLSSILSGATFCHTVGLYITSPSFRRRLRNERITARERKRKIERQRLRRSRNDYHAPSSIEVSMSGELNAEESEGTYSDDPSRVRRSNQDSSSNQRSVVFTINSIGGTNTTAADYSLDDALSEASII